MYKISRNVLKSVVWVFILAVNINAAEFINQTVDKNASGIKVDLIIGSWNFQSYGSTVTGPCPKGKEISGILEIKQESEAIILTLKTGKICRPSSICTYKGRIKDAHIIVSNSALVDSEGGKAVNSLDIVILSEDNMIAKSNSQYIHPSGMECRWLGTIKIFR